MLSRRRESGKHLILLPNVQVEECDVFSEHALGRAVQGCAAVINLVGILHETAGKTFERIHIDLPRRLARACRMQGVPRLLHMSALQADAAAPSKYLRSKAEGEAVVRDELAGSMVGMTIFRPSVIFGHGDSFLNLFASLSKAMPFMVLAMPNARFQPVYVNDVAHAFVSSLSLQNTVGNTYPLCGPTVYTLHELVRMVIRILGLKRPVIGLNDKLSYLQAWAMELLPIKLMTRDNYHSMQVDSVCDCDFPAVFDRQPTPLESVISGYLADDTPRNAYMRFRSQAGRSVA